MTGRILLIEPDVKLAMLYAAALQAAGHEVAASTTAQDAIVLADERTPDLVLLELQLVAHSGIEFLYEFRSYADWREVPVMIISHVPPAEFASSQKLLSLQLGVRAYHYKPQLSLRSLTSSAGKALEAAGRRPKASQQQGQPA